MFTLIINLHPDIKAWHLVEPFWYHLYENQQTILLEQQTMLKQIDDNLVNKVLTEIERYTPPKWQLVFIFDLHLSVGARCLSLSEQINYLQNHLLNPLQGKGQVPSASWVIALDHETRMADGSPLSMKKILSWEIDRLGYLQQSQGNDTSEFFFLNDDFDPLDELWGWPIELSQAGPQVNNPSAEFINMLQQRNEALLNGVEKLFCNKLKIVQNNVSVNCATDLLNSETLTDIKEDFKQIVFDRTQASAIEKLGYFRPSSVLKELMRKYLGIEQSARGFRILRLEAALSSEQALTYTMVRCALLISWIVTVDEVKVEWMRNRLVDGNVYHIEIDDFEPRLKELLEKQSFCLKTAMNQLKTRSLIKRDISVPAMDQGDDYTDSVALLSEDLPLIRSVGNTRKSVDLDRWKEDCRAIHKHMHRQLQHLRASVNKDIRTMRVVQRKEVRLEQETDNIEGYYEQYRKKQKDFKTQLAALNPFQHDNVGEWHRYTSGITYRMDYLLNSRPRNGTMIWCTLVAVALLFFPYLSLSRKLAVQAEPWKWVIVPLIMLVLAIGLAFLVRWQILRPIRQLIFQLRQHARELSAKQSQMAETCKEYLRLMYRVLMVNKVVIAVGKCKEERANENMLLQYHIRQMNQHLDLAYTLARRLGFPKPSVPENARYWDEHPEIKYIIENQFNLNADVISMRFYSPLSCQVILDSDLIQPCQVEICGVSEAIQLFPWRDGEIRIMIEKDRVFEP